MNESYGVVAHQRGHATRLQLNVRHGNTFIHHRLSTYAPHYEDARAEAQQLYPDRLIVVPALGEEIPNG